LSVTRLLRKAKEVQPSFLHYFYFFLKKSAKKFAYVKKKQYLCTRFSILSNELPFLRAD